MKIVVVDNYEEMSGKAVDLVERQVQENGHSVLGLATGSTPLGLYEGLIEGYKNRGISYSTIQTVNLDEYVGIPKDHPQSYHTFMTETLFSEIDIPSKQTHIPDGQPESVKDECERYEQLLDTIGPVDLQILGIGENGHIGFNEPGTPEKSLTHIVELDASTRQSNARFFSSLDEVPTHAITMGIQSILKSKKIILLASGTKKAEAIRTLMSQTISEDFPASLLWKHPDVTLILDRDACQLVDLERLDSNAR